MVGSYDLFLVRGIRAIEMKFDWNDGWGIVAWMDGKPGFEPISAGGVGLPWISRYRIQYGPVDIGFGILVGTLDPEIIAENIEQSDDNEKQLL